MGLTIHYSIQADTGWTHRQIRQKLEETRRFVLSLPIVSVSEVAAFRGQDCQLDFDSPKDEGDPFHWAKLQAGRLVSSPWRPGESRQQAPSQMICLEIEPAEGCEPMNVGWCSFPRFVWKPEKNHAPGWRHVLTSGNHYPHSEKLLRAFLRKYRLVKMPDRQGRGRLGPYESLHGTSGGGVSIRSGRYLSHRRGYGPGFVVLRLDDCIEREIRFRFRGTVEEARTLFTGEEFKADLEDMIHGKEHVIPAAHGVWSSFCKTQYANDPRVGGWPNFQRAHLSVLAVLEHLQQSGFGVEVHDESGFWKERDLAALARTVGQWDAFGAGLAGICKDATEAHDLRVQSPLLGRPDFEHLEGRALKIDSLAGYLGKLGEAMVLPCRA